MDLIYKYLIENGGIYGVLLAIALFWIFFREKFLLENGSKKEKTTTANTTSKNKVEVDKILYIVEDLKDLQKTALQHLNEITPLLDRVNGLDESIENLKLRIDILQDKFIQSNELIKNDLIFKLQKINDERVMELKYLLETYNKTVTDLIVAMEKIKILLKTEQGE